MQRLELRRVEKAARTLKVKSNEITNLWTAMPQRYVLADRSESAVSRAEPAGRFPLIQS